MDFEDLIELEDKSKIGRAYEVVYDYVCGAHPYQRPWHFQWLSIRCLRKALRQLLPRRRGRILDVGCGSKPYKSWFGEPLEYVGLDVVEGADVDVVVASGHSWPFPDEGFDVIFATQVLEHVEDLNGVIGEMDRVLKPGGEAILSFPFLYNEHGVPFDFRRFTQYAATRLLPGYEVTRLDLQGGIGSSLGTLLLNWENDVMNSSFVMRLLKGLLLPLRILVSAVVNVLSVALDAVDRTNRYYGNILVVTRKPGHTDTISAERPAG